jgi:LL-diaminopimelate aminotransferase
MYLPFQKAAIAALNGPQEYVSIVKNTYEKRGILLTEGLNNIGWHIDKPKGSMFVWAVIPEKYKSDVDFTFDLIEKTGVIVVPGSSFGNCGKGFVRIALVESEDRILQAIENINNSDIML